MKYVRPLIAGLVILAALGAIGWYLWGQGTGGLPGGVASGTGRLEARGAEFDVRFEELTDEAALRRVDEGAALQFQSGGIHDLSHRDVSALSLRWIG